MEDKPIPVFKKEQLAIKRLQKCLDAFPRTLTLFAWSGTFVVFKENKDGERIFIHSFDRIAVDGGDPDDIIQDAELDYKGGYFL